MALHTDLPVYASTRDLAKLISQVVANMQRDYKFTLGKRLDEQCIDLVMDVYRANSSANRAAIIQGMREKVVAIERIPAAESLETINSYLGLLRHCSGHRDRSRIANAARKRGHCVDAGLTKAYRRA